MHGAPEWAAAVPEADAMDLDDERGGDAGERPGLKRTLEGWEEAGVAAKRRRSLDAPQASDAVAMSHHSEWPSATAFPWPAGAGDSDSEGEIAESHMQPAPAGPAAAPARVAALPTWAEAGKENAAQLAGRQSFPSACRLLPPAQGRSGEAGQAQGRRLRSDTPARAALRGSPAKAPARPSRPVLRSVWPADACPSLRASLCGPSRPLAQARSLPGWDVLEAAEWLRAAQQQPPLPADTQPEE